MQQLSATTKRNQVIFCNMILMMVENGCASWRIPSVAANTVHTNSMTPFSTKNHDIIVVILHIFLYYWMNKWRMCFWIFHFLKIHCKYFWNFSRLSKAITSFHSVTIHTHTKKSNCKVLRIECSCWQ